MPSRRNVISLRKGVISASMGLCLFLSGCVIHPYYDKHTVATRRVNNTTIVSERLIDFETGIACTAMFAPCYAGGTTDKFPLMHSYYVEDGGGNRRRGEGLEVLRERQPGTRSMHQPKVWAINGTDLWATLKVRRDSNWDQDHRSVILDLKVFSPTAVVRQRELRAWHDSPLGQDAYKVDVTGSGILYQTRDAHRMNVYDILNDDTSPWTR